MNCPICNKAGLPENAITCPQCDSDLSGFLLIEKVAVQQKGLEVEKSNLQTTVEKEKSNKRKVIIFSSFLLLALLVSSLFLINNSKKNELSTIPQSQMQTDSLKTVIAQKDNLIQSIESENKILKEQSNVIHYVVRKGDNLMKLSRLFYNDASHYRKIMEDNNLTDNKSLLTGDTLTFNLKN